MIFSRLEKYKNQGLIRELRTVQGLVDFASNDYFGFAQQERVEKERPGSSGSRLLTGNSRFCEELEDKIARFHGSESCLFFTSGYTANLGLISCLGSEDATFLYDLEIHASMIDGMRLSDAEKKPFRHNDLDSLERRLKNTSFPAYVLVESVYSISGQKAPLTEIAALCERYGALLIVDEAHATGVYGARGEGLVCAMQLESKVFARVHTFSKALGAHGGCVLGSLELRKFLINFSRPFIYSTALPPIVLAHVAAAYEKLGSDAKMHQKRIWQLIDYFCKKNGFSKVESPIIPYLVGGGKRAKELSSAIALEGLDVRAILPPTVAKGKECLRIVVHSFNQENEIDRLTEVLCKISS